MSNSFWIALHFSLATLLIAPRCALALAISTNSTEFPVDSGLVVQSGDRVITWDGQNGIAINDLVGAGRFYNLGIWGQATVTANVEAGLIWSGHETSGSLSDSYVAPGALGEVDRHATWVGSVLAGYDPTAPGDNYPYYKLGMAPLTQLSSGAIATGWYNQTDPDTRETSTYFDTTAKTFYSAYNHYFTQEFTRTVDLAPGISVQFSAPTDVINSSWGYGDPLGTDALTRAADGLARAHPLTALVVAAGNSATASNPSNNVGGPASGYNSISVGAVGDFSIDRFNTVAEFSSRGPQDYYDPVHGIVPGVRAPVDIVAPGTSIVAAFYGGQTGGNGVGLSTTEKDTSLGATDWYSIGVAGTSFAAPIVSGGVSLLKSLSYLAGMSITSLDTRVIKSVLMNSATKLPGWDNGQHLDGSGVTVTTQSLDWAQGSGMLNLDRAFDQYFAETQDLPGTDGGDVTSTGWDFGSIQLSLTTGVVSHNDYRINSRLHAASILDVTLSWFLDLSSPLFTDNAYPDLQSLTTTDLGLANLDLQIWNADFTELFASSMSIYNATEELHFTLPADGDYAIRVIYADQMYGTAIPEDYGLAWDVTPVPEPSATMLTLLAGLGLIAVSARRRRVRAREDLAPR